MPPKRKSATEGQDTAPAATTRGRRTSARKKDASKEPGQETMSEISSRKRKSATDYQEGYILSCHVVNSVEKKTKKKAKGAVNSTAATKNDDGADDATSKTKASRKSKGAAVETSNELPDSEQLFDAYAEVHDSQTLGAEGLEKLCGDANIPMDGVQPLLLAWQLNTKELGSFSRDEWTKGLQELQITTLESLAVALLDLEELIVLRKPPPPKPRSQSISKGIKSKSAPPPLDKYKKDRYWSYVANVDSAFSQFYNFCFGLVKKEGSRSIDMDYASAFWSVILAPKYPIMTKIIEFINEKGTYKGVNKDLWSMMYEFCQSVDPSLEGYDSEGAWPTLLDDFVEWKKAKTNTICGEADA